MSILSRLLQSFSKRKEANEWQAIARPGMYVPLQMRKLGPDGKWTYRAPTEAETREYVENEAW
jgi:hypothetical protein